jgi:hypothetical protein
VWAVAFAAIGGFVAKIIAQVIAWWSAYSQGRSAERAAQAERRADESEKLADAHSRMRPVIVDDDWLHRGSPDVKTPDQHGSSDTTSTGR